MHVAPSAPPAVDVNYDQLKMATFETGHFAPPAGAMWYLMGRFDSSGDTRYVPLNSSPFKVGRRGDLSLCLPCRTVSSLHAELSPSGKVVVVRDLGSTNGTFVNGVPVQVETEAKSGDLIQFANIPMRLGREENHNRSLTAVEDVCDQALALTRFDDLMSEKAVTPYFQPIVDLHDDCTSGYEVLGRSRLFGLSSPKEMFLAAAQLNLEKELSRMLRDKGISVGAALVPETTLYVNTHPLELTDTSSLIKSIEEIRVEHPQRALCLEIHEAATPNPAAMQELRKALIELEVALAYDDFGAGQARFAELVQVPPDVLKFDITLVKGIDRARPQHLQMVSTLVRMAKELGVTTLAEGVETEAENVVCRRLGFDAAQGYYYGRPVPVSEFKADA